MSGGIDSGDDRELDSVGIVARKRRVRAGVRAGREARSSAAHDGASARLTARLTSLVTDLGARSITCYAAMPGEPDTAGLLRWALEAGVEVLLPSSRPDGRLDWVHYGGSLTPGRHGIAEPVGDPAAPGVVASVDLMLIPACAVDRHGTRLGWGGGYFDRTLEEIAHFRGGRGLPPRFAVVHESELVPVLPREPHDVPVSGVVTPEGVLRFS